MADLTTFITALEAAQNGAKFSAEVQQEAAKVTNTDDLKKAYAIAETLEGTDAKLEDPALSAALKAGFDFAATLIKSELQSKPTHNELLGLYGHFKVGSGVKAGDEDEPKQGGLTEFAKNAKYKQWKAVSPKFSQQQSQATYIKLVIDLIATYGLKE